MNKEIGYQSHIRVSAAQWFSHHSRFSYVCRFCNSFLPAQSSVLDYGTADAYVPQLLTKNIQRIKNIVAYDISSANFPKTNNNRITLTTDKDILNSQNYDLILCLETLEHVPDDKVNLVLRHLSDLCSPDTTLLISVPIEIGISSLIKNVVRFSSGQLEQISTPTNILYSIIGRTNLVKRSAVHPGHMGFNYKSLEAKISRYFTIVSKTYTPFPALRSIFNSQVFYVLELP